MHKISLSLISVTNSVTKQNICHFGIQEHVELSLHFAQKKGHRPLPQRNGCAAYLSRKGYKAISKFEIDQSL